MRRKRRRKQWEDSHLVALAVILQAAWAFAVAAFAVPTVWLSLFTFSDFGFEGLWVSIQTRLKSQKHFHVDLRLKESSSVEQQQSRFHLLTFIALSRSVSCSRLLKQLLQLQLLQNSPFAKQSQYLREEKQTVKQLNPHESQHEYTAMF